MSIPLISKIIPVNNGDFPIVEDVNIEGGYQVRSDITDRNNIPALNRKQGMLVKVLSDGKYYTLSGGILDVNWVEVDFGGGNSLKPIPINFGTGINSTNSTIFVVAGTLRFNTNELSEITGITTIKLKVIAETTGTTCTIQLYDYTNISVVSGTTLTTSSITPVELSTGDLTSVLSSGSNIYQVQIKMTGGTPETDRITISSMIFEIDWV